MNSEFDFVKEIPIKKIPKIGRVYFCLEYFVDLNDSYMVEHAKQCLYEDVMSMVKYDEVYGNIKVKESEEHSYDDIPDFFCDELKGEEE